MAGSEARPIVLGVVGDDAAGKATLSSGLVRVLGESKAIRFETDGYRRYDRRQLAEHGITPLHPECNYIDLMERAFADIRLGQAILKPVYQHIDDTFAAPVYTQPRPFTIIESVLGYHTPALRESYDVRVFLAPAEELRRAWKVQRDCSRRGCTTDMVLDELDRGDPDSTTYIQPQQRWADLVISFKGSNAPWHHDVVIILRNGLDHPDLSEFVGDSDGDVTLEQREHEDRFFVSGHIDPRRGSEIEDAVWSTIPFASRMRSQRLGELAVGKEIHRSETLAIVQVLILYYLAIAKLAVAFE